MTREASSLSPAAIDTTLEALSAASRRELLRSFSGDASIAQDDLLEPVEWGNKIELVHVHLPKLEDEGFLEWDRETGELRPGPRFEEAEPILEAIRDCHRPDRD